MHLRSECSEYILAISCYVKSCMQNVFCILESIDCLCMQPRSVHSTPLAVTQSATNKLISVRKFSSLFSKRSHHNTPSSIKIVHFAALTIRQMTGLWENHIPQLVLMHRRQMFVQTGFSIKTFATDIASKPRA